ncbi:MAG: hypothetical protein JSS75_03470 [Bacteroidetes bacterium]|nr:hypothetical protein [Bacteroidota bacterium]
MKRSAIFLLLVCVVFSSMSAKAQTGIPRDTTHWNDEDIYNPNATASAPPYAWLGAGFVSGALMTNLDDFNKNVSQPFLKQDLSATIPLFGAHLFFPFPWVKNLRVGGVFAMGRSQVCCVPDTASSGQPLMRTLRVSTGYGGITLDYNLPVRISRCHVLAGIELGVGSLNVWAKQAANRTSFDINNEFDNASSVITHTYSASMIVFKPQVTFEWAPLNFLMLRASLGYQGTSIGTWYADEDVSLGNTDKLSTTKGGGLVANAGIYLGIFQ